jgi:hypothetical protein
LAVTPKQCLEDQGQEALIGARKCGLLLQEAAILLDAAVPAASFHAERLPQTAIGDAGRNRASVEALIADRDACLLLATAPHGSRDRGLDAKHAKANQSCGDERINDQLHAVGDITLHIDSFRQLRATADFALNQIRVSQWG